MNQQQTERQVVIELLLDRSQANLLNEALAHCHHLFGGNDQEFDEMLIDVSRKLLDENNIRETNIV